jgi:hypothetical protein
MEQERILRSSVWLDDGNDIMIEVIWEKPECQSGEGTRKGVARLCLSVEEAGNLHDKLHHALMTALRYAPRPEPAMTTT